MTQIEERKCSWEDSTSLWYLRVDAKQDVLMGSRTESQPNRKGAQGGELKQVPATNTMGGIGNKDHEDHANGIKYMHVCERHCPYDYS